MATVTGLTAARMLAIEAASVISGLISGDNLILTKFDGSTINAGNVRGPTGLTPTLRGLSVTSLAIGTGSKVFAISPAMAVAFPVGAIVKASGTTPTNYMVGNVTASSTTSVTINVTETSGVGTLASWVLTIGSFKGTDGVLTGTAGGDLQGSYPNPTLVTPIAQALAPTGVILPFAGITAPAGWLLAQGQWLLRADYPSLYNVLGVTFNIAGDTDVNYFRIPDMQDRGPVGASGTKARGSKAGNATAAIAAANLPAHTHSMTHDHTMKSRQSAGPQLGYVTSTGGTVTPENNSAIDAFTGSTGSAYTASPTPLNTQDPYLALHHIIKT